MTNHKENEMSKSELLVVTGHPVRVNQWSYNV